VMGPSGSGKSTLLNIMGGLDVATSGRYLLEGVEVTRLPDEELARIRCRHFGFVFQSYNLFPDLTAIENVIVPMIYAGEATAHRTQRAAQLLDSLGMGHRLRHLPSQLSGGEQQRVAIARALANDPDVIFADEPTGNLATAQGQEILDILEGLKRERGHHSNGDPQRECGCPCQPANNHARREDTFGSGGSDQGPDLTRALFLFVFCPIA